MTDRPKDADEIDSVLDEAVAAIEAEEYEEALEKFIWFHDASRGVAGLGGVRSSFALGFWIDLAARFPPALEAFVQLRDKTEQQCRDLGGDYESFSELASLNLYLNQVKRTADLYMEIARDFPEKAERLYNSAKTSLIAEEMYQECAPYLDWERCLDDWTRIYEINLKMEEDLKEDDPPRFQLFLKLFRKEIAQLVALLTVNKRNEDASEVSQRSLKMHDDEEFREMLEAALNGKFPKDSADSIRSFLYKKEPVK